nr:MULTISPECIES: zinc-ribbon domain-containing protein [Pectobacterium]
MSVLLLLVISTRHYIAAYLVSEDQTSPSVKQLQRIIAQLAPVQRVTHWRCTMCGSHYRGKKQRSLCKTGIYSREI